MVACAWAEPSDLGSQRGINIHTDIMVLSSRHTLACCFAAVRPNTQNAESGYACKAETWVGSILRSLPISCGQN